MTHKPSQSHQALRQGQISYYAAIAHRLSGIALACFLPLHFLSLGLALEGAESMDAWLAYTDLPLVKFGEWGLVVLLTLHMVLGLRVLLLEWLATAKQGLGLIWIGVAVILCLVLGGLFLLAVL